MRRRRTPTGPSPVLRRVAVAFGMVMLVAAACGDDDDETVAPDPSAETTTTVAADPAADPTSTSPSSDPAETSTTVADPAPADPEPVDTTTTVAAGTNIDIAVVGGTVDGGGRVSVPLGDTVTVTVVSDVADEVHLHGYDVLVDAEAGQPAVLEFVAEIPGVFEIELEDAGLQLAELEVG